MELILEINNLSLEDYDILLPRINLIKDKVYPKLEIDYTLLKRNPNSIRINQEIEDSNVAMTLFKLFNNLNFNQKSKMNVIEFKCSLNNRISKYGR